MNTFTSVFDLLENNASLASVKDEILNMKIALKKHMDTGLTPDEMEKAQIKNQALLAAEEILEKL